MVINDSSLTKLNNHKKINLLSSTNWYIANKMSFSPIIWGFMQIEQLCFDIMQVPFQSTNLSQLKCKSNQTKDLCHIK